MIDYLCENSSNVYGTDIDLGWILRISTLDTKAAQPIDWHLHSALEIVCCAKGKVDYEFESAPSVTLKRGEFIVIPPRLRHRLVHGLDRPSSRFSIFLTPRAQAERLGSLFTPAEYSALIRRLRERQLTPLSAPPVAIPLVTSMPAEITAGLSTDGIRRFQFKARVLAVIAAFADGTNMPTGKDETAIIDEAAAYLRQNLRHRISMDDLVKRIGYGRSRFYELFKSRTGFSPLEWLTRQRVEQARSFLERGSTPAVAMRESGFNDRDFFRCVFRRLVGVSPAEYARTFHQTLLT